MRDAADPPRTENVAAAIRAAERLDAFDWRLSGLQPLSIALRWALFAGCGIAAAAALVAGFARTLGVLGAGSDGSGGADVMLVMFGGVGAAVTHSIVATWGRAGGGRWGAIVERASRALPSADAHLRAAFEVLPGVRMRDARPCRVLFAPHRLLIVTSSRPPWGVVALLALFASPLLARATTGGMEPSQFFGLACIGSIAFAMAAASLGRKLEVFEIPDDDVLGIDRRPAFGDIEVRCSTFGVPERLRFVHRLSQTERLAALLEARFGPGPPPPLPVPSGAPGPSRGRARAATGGLGADPTAADRSAESAEPLSSTADLRAWLARHDRHPVDERGRPLHGLTGDSTFLIALVVGALLLGVSPLFAGIEFVPLALFALGLAPLLYVRARRHIVDQRFWPSGRWAVLGERLVARADACVAGARLRVVVDGAGPFAAAAPRSVWVFGETGLGVVTRTARLRDAAPYLVWFVLVAVALGALAPVQRDAGVFLFLHLVVGLFAFRWVAARTAAYYVPWSDVAEALLDPEGLRLVGRPGAALRSASLTYPARAAEQTTCIARICGQLVPALRSAGVPVATWTSPRGTTYIEPDDPPLAPADLHELISGTEATTAGVEHLLAAVQQRYQE